MSINQKMWPRIRWTIYKVVAVLMIALTVSVMFDMQIESCKRVQARYNLDSIKYCIDRTLSCDVDRTKAIGICTTKMKTTFTGDVYVLDYASLEFISETSRDVPKGAVYFTEESIGTEFADWDSAVVALSLMTSGKDSIAGLNAWYNYDGDVEWLEWINYYIEGDDNPLIIVQGTQRDETMHKFKILKLFIMLSTIVVVITMLASGIRTRGEDNGRKHCASDD